MSAPPRFIIERLADRHDRSTFACGVEWLDAYLARQAGQDVRRGAAAVYVACAAGSDTVSGYYSLSASSLHAGSLPEAVRKRLPRYPELPAVLLGRLAVDERWQRAKTGLGSVLLLDALKRCHAHNDFGVMFVIVDPIPEARGFYGRLQFRDIPDQERMYLPMTEVAKLFP